MCHNLIPAESEAVNDDDDRNDNEEVCFIHK